MAEIYLNLLILICFCLLVWGIIRPERVYQYPFFMGMIFISFLVPQAFALTKNPGQVSQVALERVLLVSSTCAAACWIGYKLKPNKKWLVKLNITLDERKLFKAGIALMVMGYFFLFLINNTTAQIAANGNWTGPVTIYLFFYQVIYIAFGIFIFQTLKRPSVSNLIFTAITSVPLIQTVIVYGRRQPTMTLFVIIGVSFFIVRQYTPPRWIFITIILLITLLIPAFGLLRGNFWTLLFSGNWQEVLSLSQNAFNLLIKGDVLELRNAALLMDAAESTNRYGYGTGYWDSMIFQFVPGQIVGFDLKRLLQFNNFESYDLSTLYGYSIPNGSTITGIGDSFIEVSYFCCIIFAFIGYIFKNLWISSVYYGSTFSRLLYIGLISPAMVGLTHGTGRFLQEAIYQLIFVGLVTYYCRVKYKANKI